MAVNPSTPWRKSRRSSSTGQCVEVHLHTGVISVRDSKDPAGGILEFSAGRWTAFTAALKTELLAE